MKFHVPDMSCGGCVRAVSAAITVLDAQAKVEADTVSRTISVDTAAAAPEVMKALDEAGFPATAA
ncbi:heavy-metal-associated domain-containing protein [Paracoccus versutus]|uniref:Copper chaperone n=1 Tax=Paracoccus versutus TaxID=34007 RepID=A0A3D9XYQ7_PARVE|nr:heavy-metal-associated domain-containing protein [Paracoccus versutus]REF73412.1 copper chaperone [Paracoccus versutus]WGR54569.1 copper chaperone [Paracoccus versutus]